MINIINASPKINSNSSNFINLIIKNLKEKYVITRIYKEEMHYIINNINKASIIIIVFPLYVDCLPSKLIEIMENYKDFNNKKIYVVCNCGFLESKQNNLAIDIIKNWCKNSNGIFMGLFKIGAGEVLGHKGFLRAIFSPFFKLKIYYFSTRINKNKKVNLSSSLILPKKVFCICANKFWQSKLNKI